MLDFINQLSKEELANLLNKCIEKEGYRNCFVEPKDLDFGEKNYEEKNGGFYLKFSLAYIMSDWTTTFKIDDFHLTYKARERKGNFNQELQEFLAERFEEKYIKAYEDYLMLNVKELRKKVLSKRKASINQSSHNNK